MVLRGVVLILDILLLVDFGQSLGSLGRFEPSLRGGGAPGPASKRGAVALSIDLLFLAGLVAESGGLAGVGLVALVVLLEKGPFLLGEFTLDLFYDLLE